MPDYRKLYFKLFAAMADAVDSLEQGDLFHAKERLIQAQLEGEEAHLDDQPETPPLKLL